MPDLAKHMTNRFNREWRSFDVAAFFKEFVASDLALAERLAEEFLGWCPACGGTGEIVLGHPHDPDARYEVCGECCGPTHDEGGGRA